MCNMIEVLIGVIHSVCRQVFSSIFGAPNSFIIISKLLAQGDPPDNGGPTPPNPPPAEIPIDGGASLLLAGGVAYGLKKLRDRRKKK